MPGIVNWMIFPVTGCVIHLARKNNPSYKGGMQAFDDIFGIWNSITAMSTAVGENYDTVRKWRSNKRIPETSWRSLIQAAALRGHLLTADDLLRLNTPPPKRGDRPSKPSRKSQVRAAG